VQRHAVALNPFASVRGLKYSVTEGKTAELAIEQARKLFRSIDNGHIVGLRDRAVLGVLAYTGTRIGAVAKLRLADYRNLGDQAHSAEIEIIEWQTATSRALYLCNEQGFAFSQVSTRCHVSEFQFSAYLKSSVHRPFT
jgi:site-specific recombinase XerD